MERLYIKIIGVIGACPPASPPTHGGLPLPDGEPAPSFVFIKTKIGQEPWWPFVVKGKSKKVGELFRLHEFDSIFF